VSVEVWVVFEVDDSMSWSRVEVAFEGRQLEVGVEVGVGLDVDVGSKPRSGNIAVLVASPIPTEPHWSVP
jgi:hypothetical protein